MDVLVGREGVGPQRGRRSARGRKRTFTFVVTRSSSEPRRTDGQVEGAQDGRRNQAHPQL
jgi:hypothetical protein